MEEIKTAVDSMIELVKREKKISIDEAAKQLNLPVAIVHEWAVFLEDAGVFEIEYKLSKPYLRISDPKRVEHLKKNKDDMDKEREILIVKTQAALKDVKAKSEFILWLKKEFLRLSSAKKKLLAKPFILVMDQKSLLEEEFFKLLIDLKNFKVKKESYRHFDRLRERFKKMEDRVKIFEQNLQKISNHLGGLHAD